MKYIEFVSKGKHYKIYHDTTKEAINQVLGEVFVIEYYKKGLQWIKKVENPVIVDVGAYIGDSILYLNQCKNATFYGLEPCKSNYECLFRTTEGMKNVNIFNNGLMNAVETIKLDQGRTPGSGGESIYEYDSGSEDISVIDIETFVNTLSIKHVDLLKIDVEGAEYEIFGGPAFEKVCPMIDAIIGETHLKPTLPVVAEKILTSLGYKVEWLPYKNYHYAWHLDWGDYHKRVELDMATIFFAHR